VLLLDVFYYLACLFLIVFSGIRENVGVDYSSYSDLFSEIRHGGEGSLFEPLNMAIINFAHFIGAGNAFIFSVYSFVILAGVFRFAKSFGVSKEIAVFIFMTVSIFYLSSFNLVRQWAAISMMLFAINSLIERNFYRMLFFILLACMFHLSALVLIVIPFLANRFNKSVVLAIVIASVAFSGVFLLAIEQLPFVRYLGDSFRSDRAVSNILLLIYIFSLFFPILYIGYFNNNKIIPRKEVVILNMNLISILILLISAVLQIDFQAAMRVNLYFAIQLIVVLPLLLSKFNGSLKIIIYPVFLMSLSVIFFYTLIFKGDEYMLTPFKYISL
jgi:hypothetical protein